GSIGFLRLNDIADNSTIQTAGTSRNGFKLKVNDIGDGVDFNIADKIRKFRADEYKGGTLTADSIRKLYISDGILGADVTTRPGGGIDKVNVEGDITGTIESATFIKQVLSREGSLTNDAAIIAQDGSINRAMFGADLKGTVLASEKIGRVSSADGTLSGIVRAGDKINNVRFREIESAIVSSGGNINKIYAGQSIVDTAMLAGYDIGPDGLPGTGDDIFDPDGSFTIGNIHVNPKTGNFFGSQAAAGVKPFDYDPITGTWTILAPEGHTQELAIFGKIGPSGVGQVFDGDPDIGVYGLFAATEVGKVKFTEIPGANAPDFDIIWNWV
ncbi:hypothetical protein ACFL02_09855, partial [Planctomycetota bacterium]